jgi:hypothetical protein
MDVTDERRAQLSRAGKIGGRRRWITHPVPPEGIFDEAQRRFRLSFLTGHECKACPKTDIDPTWPEEVRRKAAERLRRDHYRRLAERSAAKRAAE